MSQSDDDLVRLAQQGERSAFDELVRRTSRLLYARLYLHTGDAHLAEDLLQDTYLRAHRSFRHLKEPDKLRSWLLAIAQNAATDAARRESSRTRNAPSPTDIYLATISATDATPEENAERAEMRDGVLEILRSLPEEYRSALSLRYFTGADYQTMQTQLGCTNGSLRGLLHRGMQMLRERLMEKYGKEFFEE